MLAPLPLAASAPPADVILEEANQYTVKIRRASTVGLNEDDGTSAQATGFLVDSARGWILTNAHVASRSPATLTVSFKGEKYISARRIFVDRLLDVAVLEVEPTAMPSNALAAQLECEYLPKMGSAVAIFGHPGDFSYTATRGIISSISWIFPTEQIQSDAVINGGNSGGPLIDLSTGRIVGVAAASYRDTADEHSVSVSLSEPMPPICDILDLLKSGRDARFRQLPVSYATADDDDRPIVAAVFDRSSGLKIGDRIVAVNGHSNIRNTSVLAARLRGIEGAVKITVERDQREINVNVVTTVMPEVTTTRSINISGLVISNQWKLDNAELPDVTHPIIDFVYPGSDAELTKATPGYHVAAVNNRTFPSLEELFKFLETLPSGADVSFVLQAASEISPFLKQYHHVTLPKGELYWIEASQAAE